MKELKLYFVLLVFIVAISTFGSGCSSNDEGSDNGADQDSIEQPVSDGDKEETDSKEIVDETETMDSETITEEENDETETNISDGDTEIDTETEIESDETNGDTETEIEDSDTEGEIDGDTVEVEYEEIETETEEEFIEEEQDVELVCLPGERYCYTEQKLAVCSEDGMSWQRIFCGEDAVCTDSRCVPLVCEPNEPLCSGQLVLRCNDTGTSMSIEDECNSHSECRNGGCVDLCMEVEEIFPDTLIIGSTEDKENKFNQSSKCWSAGGVEVHYPGPDTWYRIHLNAGQTVTFKLTSLTRHFDPALYIFDVCDLIAPQCITGSDACCAGTPEIIRFTAPKEGYYWVVVDSWDGNTGQFELKTTGGPTPDADPGLGAMAYTIDEETNTLTLSATLHNSGTETIPRIEVGFYPNIDHKPNPAEERPEIIVEQYNLMPGESRNVEANILRPAAGNYSAWAVADPDIRIYDPDRTNNFAGPLGFAITGEFEEIHTTLPCKEDGRIQAEGAKSYYSFQCLQHQIIALKVSIPEGSSLLPQLKLIANDRTTQLDIQRADNTEDLPLVIRHKCEETGTYLAEVSASSSASDEHTTGTFSIEIAPIQTFYAFPPSVKLYPGKQITAKVMATWQNDILPEGELPQDMFEWMSLTPDVVTIGAPGEIKSVGSVNEGFGTVAITSGGDTAPSYIFVEISRQIPGNIYQSNDRFPLTIPDEGQIRSTVYVTNPNRIQQLFVGVSITHRHTGDLKLTLRSPQGTEVVLYDGDPNQINLLTIFGIITDVSGPGSLEDFIGEPASGVWELFVMDKRSGEVGRLNSWRLYIVHEED